MGRRRRDRAGGEGGGHTGAVPTSLLLPQVVDAVDIPVLAAGGFFDGRGLVAALAYGAAGIAMGTRFLLTSDSTVPDAVKQVYLAAVLTARSSPGRSTACRSGCCARRWWTGWSAAAGRATLLRRPQRAAVPRGPGCSLDLLLAGARCAAAASCPGRRSDGREHADAAAGGDGRRPSRPRPDVVRPGRRLIDDLPTCAELIDRSWPRPRPA